MQKIPTQVDLLHSTRSDIMARCRYSFVFSNNIEDWIHSKHKLYNRKGYRNVLAKTKAQHKLNTNEDG